MQTLRFLDLDFDIAEPADWRDLMLAPPAGGFRYLVTPNVDHVVQLSKRPEIAPIYAAADWRMCDSRILARLGRLSRLDLKCYPGADLVRDLLDDPRSTRLRIAVVGPDATDFTALRAQYPHHDLALVEAPMMQPGSPAWDRTLAGTEAIAAPLTLLCISFPKQEVFARDLKIRGRLSGTAICAGASVNFLTGTQRRAPEALRKMGLEWLYRLLSEPRRLWKRYLIDGPRIFWLYFQDRTQPRP